MENGVGVSGAPIQNLHGLFGREDEQFNFAPPSLTSDLIHDWQCSGARANHQPMAFPGYLLFQRQRRVTDTVPKLLGRFLVALPDLSPVDDDVVTVRNAIDPNLPKCELLELHDQGYSR